MILEDLKERGYMIFNRRTSVERGKGTLSRNRNTVQVF